MNQAPKTVESSPGASFPRAHAASRTARVLVVEDDAAMRMLLEDTLREAGYKVTATGNALSALIYVLAVRVDLVVSDWRMPDYNGLAFAAALRRCRPDVPWILISAFVDPVLLKDALRLRASAVIDKPFRLARLLDEMERALAGPRNPGSSQPRRRCPRRATYGCS